MRDFARAVVIVVTLLFLMAEAEVFDGLVETTPAANAEQTDF